MNKFLKITALISAVALMSVPFVGCTSDNDDTSVVESSTVEKLDSATLKAEIIGEWGRLDEGMHYFLEDMSCIIGGMQGTYDIDENSALVLTTMSGSVTVYEWAESRADATTEHYWNMVDGVITIDGNNFTKISSETPDFVQ